MKFKSLDIKTDTVTSKRNIFSSHLFKSVLYILIGAIAGFILFYLTEGKHLNTLTTGDILRSTLTGAFLGFFISNSPCARNKC